MRAAPLLVLSCVLAFWVPVSAQQFTPGVRLTFGVKVPGQETPKIQTPARTSADALVVRARELARRLSTPDPIDCRMVQPVDPNTPSKIRTLTPSTGVDHKIRTITPAPCQGEDTKANAIPAKGTKGK